MHTLNLVSDKKYFKVTDNFKTFCFTFEFKHNGMSSIKIRIRYVSYTQS